MYLAFILKLTANGPLKIGVLNFVWNWIVPTIMYGFCYMLIVAYVTALKKIEILLNKFNVIGLYTSGIMYSICQSVV